MELKNVIFEMNEYVCKIEQLRGRLEARIEGGIHAARLLWQQHTQEEN